MSRSFPRFSDLRNVHVIGACGTLMGAFSAFLKRQGIGVTGSDQNVYPPMSDVLRAAGVQLFQGYRAENLTELPQKPDIVVIGNVISASNPEARAAIDRGYTYVSLPEFMEHLLLQKTKNFVVAGTHGKTTTSSMLAVVLNDAGLSPSYFIGGVSADLPHSFHVSALKDGGAFVLEGDEYDTAFWDKVPKFNHYCPDQVILTSVEFDHADIYADYAAVERAFEGLISRIRPGGRLVACVDYAGVEKLIQKSKVPVLTYGTGPGARFSFRSTRSEGETQEFEVLENGKPQGRVTLQSPGAHNALNALAVWIIARENGIAPEKIARALAGFKGVKRRQEVRGVIAGITVVDDFAHHPTAVRETLKALRSKYPGQRLFVVFEPRSATSRRKVFQKEYGDAFGHADITVIAKPYDQTKIPESDQFSSDQLVDDLKSIGKQAFLMDSVAQGVSEVVSKSRPGDVIAVLSNGGFDGFIPKLMDSLKQKER